MRIHQTITGSRESEAIDAREHAIIRIVPISGSASRRLLRTLAGFGMGVREHASTRPPASHPDAIARIVDACSQARGRIVLLQGESGCGKSTHLQAAHRALLASGAACRMLDLGAWQDPRAGATADSRGGSVIDRLRGPRADALALLSAVGLGDALLMAQHPDTLSEGQSARLRIARAVSRLLERRERDGPRAGANAPRVLLIDEFASVLDRTSARTLCRTLAKLVRRSSAAQPALGAAPPLSLVLATAHDDVEAWLAPDLSVRLHSRWEHVGIGRAA